MAIRDAFYLHEKVKRFPLVFDNFFKDIYNLLDFALFQDIFIDRAGINEKHLGYLRIFEQAISCKRRRTMYQNAAGTKTNLTLFKGPQDQIRPYKFQDMYEFRCVNEILKRQGFFRGFQDSSGFLGFFRNFRSCRQSNKHVHVNISNKRIEINFKSYNKINCLVNFHIIIFLRHSTIEQNDEK